MNKKIDVEKTIKAIIEQEGDTGIQLIRDIVTRISKGKRRKQKRGNTFNGIAFEVYSLMVREGYSRIRAIEKVSVDKNLAEPSINNHLRKFNNKAKEDDYMNFGANVQAEIDSLNRYTDDKEENWAAFSFGDKFNLEFNTSVAYYLKYRIDIKKESNRNFERDKTSIYFNDIDPSIPF